MDGTFLIRICMDLISTVFKPTYFPINIVCPISFSDQFLWKLIETRLINKGGVWSSTDHWNLNPEGKIKNNSKNLVLGTVYILGQ